MAIEYTDRYGGHPPSWLRACFECQAMGCWYPEDDPRLWPPDARPAGTPEEDGSPDDGWRFIRCAACRGSGRVPGLRSALRVPLWVCKGVRFVWDMGVLRNKRCRPLEWTWGRQFATVLACAFLVDLGLWHPVAQCERWPEP